MEGEWELLYNQTREAAINTKSYADSLQKVMNVLVKTLDQANDIITSKEHQIKALKKSVRDYDKEVQALRRKFARLN